MIIIQAEAIRQGGYYTKRFYYCNYLQLELDLFPEMQLLYLLHLI